MLVSDMRPLRAIYTHNQFFKRTLTKSSLISFTLQNPNFSRHFHSSSRLHCAEEPSSATDSLKTQNDSSSYGANRRVWSVFGTVSRTSVATRVADRSSDRQEPKSENESEGESESDSRLGLSNLGNRLGGEFEKDKADMSIKKANPGAGYFRDRVRSKKKGKVKTSWVCSTCGEGFGQWWGACRACRAVGTVTKFTERDDDVSGGKVTGFEVSEKVMRSWMPAEEEVGPMRLRDVNRGFRSKARRIPLPGLFGSEVERVLGGGVVPGSLVFIGGDPGVGKSTLVLQMASLMAEGHEPGKAAPVVYVSGEESAEQIGGRADRMQIEAKDLFLYSSTDIEDILDKIQSLNPQALIIDSIQTVYLKGVVGSAGGTSQVKECTFTLLRFAKKTNIPVLLVGHVTKSGDIAGPKVLEHIVDVVLYMEGEKNSSHRLLRSVKNRFGSTDELGVFEMSQQGLQAVLNPSGMFLSEQYSGSQYLAGLAVAVIMDGSRTFLIEIQALCVADSTVSRQINGISATRAHMIISVLAKQAGLKLQENAVFLNVLSGVAMKETAGDLAIAAAICSSFLEFPIPNSIAFIGEIGLGGELRPVARMDKRLHTVAKLGYKKCIVPKSTGTSQESLGLEGLEDIEIIGCKDLKEVISNVFKQ